MLQAGVRDKSSKLPAAAISLAHTEAPTSAVVFGATTCIMLFKKSSN